MTYVVALAQFVTLALVFNKGAPHRRPLFTNLSLVVALAAQVRVRLCLCVCAFRQPSLCNRDSWGRFLVLQILPCLNLRSYRSWDASCM